MLKQEVVYTDFNGEEIKEELYFHLSKTELIEMQLSEEGGLQTRLRNIVDRKDGREIIKAFKDIVLKSYGIKTPDGKGFDKSDEIRHKFECSIAYDTFMSMLLDGGKAAEFINGIIPDSVKEQTNTSSTPVSVVK